MATKSPRSWWQYHHHVNWRSVDRSVFSSSLCKPKTCFAVATIVLDRRTLFQAAAAIAIDRHHRCLIRNSVFLYSEQSERSIDQWWWIRVEKWNTEFIMISVSCALCCCVFLRAVMRISLLHKSIIVNHLPWSRVECNSGSPSHKWLYSIRRVQGCSRCLYRRVACGSAKWFFLTFHYAPELGNYCAAFVMEA